MELDLSDRHTARRRHLALAVTLVLAVTPGSALASPAPSPARARLEGSFVLAGLVTVASNVVGEHVGELVARTWRFISPCAAGPCQTVVLARARATGTDLLLLHLRAPGYYYGAGVFHSPLRCGAQTYVNGEGVPFTVRVRVTGARPVAGVLVATRVSASYRNRSRSNLTPCFAVLGHDAATYHGHLVLPSPPTPAPTAGSPDLRARRTTTAGSNGLNPSISRDRRSRNPTVIYQRALSARSPAGS